MSKDNLVEREVVVGDKSYTLQAMNLGCSRLHSDPRWGWSVYAGKGRGGVLGHCYGLVADYPATCEQALSDAEQALREMRSARKSDKRFSRTY